MIETLSPKKELEDLQADLREVQELLRRHRLVERLVERQEMPKHELVESLVHRRNVAELRAKLDSMHPADIAYVLESLPLEERLVVWNLVKAERDGEILLQASDAVRETLIRSMDLQELVAATEQLEADEIADLAPDLPEEVIHDVFQALPVEEREQLRAAMSYPEDAVGALMDFDVVSVREDTAIETVTRYLRRFDALPHHTDQIFVVDRDERLKGVLPLSKLIVSELEHNVGKVMVGDVVTLQSGDKAQDAAKAFERYDLVSAPVVDEQGKLVGRVTVDKVVDFIRSKSESELLTQAGLREEEDVFSSVWASVKNRWSWLAINLVTAFAKGARKKAARKGAGRLASERPYLGQRARSDRLLALSEGLARSGHDGGDDVEPCSFRDRRSADPAHHDSVRARPGARLLGPDHGHHRQRRVFHFPGFGDAIPGVTCACAKRPGRGVSLL